MATEQKAAISAPYMSWTTFTSFIGELNKKGSTPPRIDTSLLTSKAGNVQSQIRNALAFFGLTQGAAHDVTTRLRELVAAHGNKEKWQDALQVLLLSYAPITGELDANATHQQLEEAMEKGGLKGSVPKQKGARFYLSLSNEAGVKVSPHFKALRRGAQGRKVGTPRARAARQKNSSNGEGAGNGTGSPSGNGTAFVPPAGTQVIKPLPDSDFTVCLPESMTEPEIFFILTHFMDFLKLRKGWFKNSKVDFGTPTT